MDDMIQVLITTGNGKLQTEQLFDPEAKETFTMKHNVHFDTLPTWNHANDGTHGNCFCFVDKLMSRRNKASDNAYGKQKPDS